MSPRKAAAEKPLTPVAADPSPPAPPAPLEPRTEELIKAKFIFTPATKRQAKLRLTLDGPPGAGKTYSALAIASALGQRIALIDTEHGSASKYAGDPFTFDALALESFEPRTYVQAIQAAEAGEYDVLVIDSLSHAWAGKGGALEQVDQRAGLKGNKFSAWRDVTPMHNELVDTILGARLHVIATMRTKTEYAVEEDGGRHTIRKLGLAPVQRDGMEYEFDVVGDLDLAHNLHITKTRCRHLDDAVVPKPGAQLAKILADWLTDGVPVLSRAAQQQLGELLRSVKGSPAYDAASKWRTEHRYGSWTELFARATEPEAAELTELIEAKRSVVPIEKRKTGAESGGRLDGPAALITVVELTDDQRRLLEELGKTLNPPWTHEELGPALDRLGLLGLRDRLLGLHAEQHGKCHHFEEALLASQDAA
jgi:hypothetical protein